MNQQHRRSRAKVFVVRSIELEFSLPTLMKLFITSLLSFVFREMPFSEYGADDEDVISAHCGSSPPVCSAAMYLAYQSGQFSSRPPPVRFSCSP